MSLWLEKPPLLPKKIELLLAARAKVLLISEKPNEALKNLIKTSDSGITHRSRSWKLDDFANITLAIGDFDTRSDAEIFSGQARESNLSVHIINEADLSDFQFGSIVNRSPVIVAVSSDSHAPALEATIRKRIEMMLPLSLAEWAKRAKAISQILTESVPDLKTQKLIWDRFSQTAFKDPVEKIDDFIRSAAKMGRIYKSGSVTLVGAGPGDSELLTLKSVRALQSADVILFDRLVSDQVLELARRKAKRMLVGKRGGQASCRQDDINALMVKLAKQGKNVVRLKSGDPMIFGRAGEELAILKNEGIETAVIPGITAAMAAASRLGISLTHRDCSQSVKFITAHSRHGELPDLDWKSCADSQTTLIVYMGAKTAPKLAEALIAQGSSPKLPVIIAKGVSRADEEVTYHHLEDFLKIEINRDMPVLLGIGRVFEQGCIISASKTNQNTLSGDTRFLSA